MRQKLLVFEEIGVQEVKFFLGACSPKKGIGLALHFATYHVIELSLEPTCIDTLFSGKLYTEICH
jgi:hypothetical protein